jgi:hypothetical protein
MAESSESQSAQCSIELTEKLRSWIGDMLSMEASRVASMGSKCLPVPVFDFATEEEDSSPGSEDKCIVHVILAKTK